MKKVQLMVVLATIASGLFAQGLDAFSGKTFTQATPVAVLSEGAAVTNVINTGAAIGRSALVTQYKVNNQPTANLQVRYASGTNTVGTFVAIPAAVIAPLSLTNVTGISTVSVVPVRLANRYLRTIVTSSANATNALVSSVFIAE